MRRGAPTTSGSSTSCTTPRSARANGCAARWRGATGRTSPVSRRAARRPRSPAASPASWARWRTRRASRKSGHGQGNSHRGGGSVGRVLRPAPTLVDLEGDIVVGDRLHRRLLVAAAPGHRRAAALHRRPRTAAAASAAEQRDGVGLGLWRVAPVFLLFVPLARLQAALDVDLLALGEIFLQALRLLAPQDDAVPLGFFLALPALVVPHLGGREIQRGDRRAAGRVAKLRVAPEISHEDYLVHASHSRLRSGCRSGQPIAGPV